MSHQDLVDAATTARANAYAPYSRFAVGAAVSDVEGRIFVGANVENASYGLTICAERAAIAAAASAGSRKLDRLVVVSDAVPPSAPCGACRQVMREFGQDMTVTSVSSGGSRSWRLVELLPDAFGPGDLSD